MPSSARSSIPANTFLSMVHALLKTSRIFDSVSGGTQKGTFNSLASASTFELRAMAPVLHPL
jgi:hypothetical protein